jgi:alanine dehydrogenase
MVPPPLPLLYLGAADVEELLPVEECIGLMEAALRTLARGAAVQPLRSVLRLGLPDAAGATAAGGAGNLLGMMPGELAVAPAGPAAGAAAGGVPTGSIAGIKVVTIVPGNRERGLESHLGAVLLFESDTGRPIAHLDAAAITAVRTAAVSALATRLLARDDAGDLALLGAGVQARWHLAALAAVRPLRRVRVWSRRPASAERFVATESARHPGLAITAAPTAAAAAAGADLICTVTGARQPILTAADVAAGAHLNAVGACAPAARELDSATVAAARLFVDRRESTLHESGDFLVPLAEGAIAADHIQGELGDLLLGRVAGRRTPRDITLFKSLGLAVEDLAAAHHVYRQALARGRGPASRPRRRRPQRRLMQGRVRV